MLAQRLVRRVCPHCRESYNPHPAMKSACRRMGVTVEEFVRGRGCDLCRKTGFSGRIGIHELLVVDEPMRDLIAGGATLTRLTAFAKDRGVAPLRYDGLRKVKEGLTTIEEVLRVSPDGWVPNRGEDPAACAEAPVFADCARTTGGGPADVAALVRELTGAAPVPAGGAAAYGGSVFAGFG